MKSHQLITSMQHPIVKHLVKLRLDPKHRKQSKTLLLEGVKPIQEVSQTILKVFYTPAYKDIALSLNVDSWEITTMVLNKISGLTTPEGLIAEVKIPLFTTLENATQVLVFDGISDPGNMGTLLRTALAFGWDTIFLLPNCCDLFNEKCLRSARGAHFKLNLTQGHSKQLEEWTKRHQIQGYVADISGISVEKIPSSKHQLLVMGNEAHGPSQEIFEFCTSMTIPMTHQMESLNVAVAGGILLYELSKKK
ncbi:MAG: RNA methyltransferase [Parachlamydiaceae bacterium]|nr:RNA methyltransferase [Parachlamydiaceae bacterium]